MFLKKKKGACIYICVFFRFQPSPNVLKFPLVIPEKKNTASTINFISYTAKIKEHTGILRDKKKLM